MLQTRSQEKPEKILVAMAILSDGTTAFQKYEDIVVKAFQLFPEDFALRGHPEYPDSSDIHKPLYGVLKRRGLVRSANKNFALTALGVEVANQLREHLHDSEIFNGPTIPSDRMSRDVESEIERMLKSAAYQLFADGNREKILDTDFYAFLGCTVRTPRNDFLGRLAATQRAIDVAKKLRRPDRRTARLLSETWNYLHERFGPLIKARKASKR